MARLRDSLHYKATNEADEAACGKRPGPFWTRNWGAVDCPACLEHKPQKPNHDQPSH